MAHPRSTFRPSLLAGLAGMLPCIAIVIGFDLPRRADVAILIVAALSGIACFLGTRFLLSQ